jgi:Caspase domain
MHSKIPKGSRIYALLIGIDCYLPNVLPDGSSYSSLGGCVRDITEVEAFLNRKLQLPDQQIIKLTASNSGTTEPKEPREQWPTYENMVAAFNQVTHLAQAGDQVYIHYSGHGGRTQPTLLPEQKGVSGFDEALVPTDIGNSTARYLRDVEMAHVLRTMVDKGLIVTIVLDSCHSGSATRGVSGDTVRGLNTIDTTSRPLESLVASRDMLAETWRLLDTGVTRGFQLGSGWLPEVKDYVLLAACRATESAYEHRFDQSGKHGVLTYWFLDSLRQLRPGLTFKQLHDRVLAKVHSEFVLQTPQLQGDASRTVLGVEHIQPFYAVNVMRVEPVRKRLLLNAGQVHALRKGAQFIVYPPDATDFTQSNLRQALIEITELGATDSWATVLTSFLLEPIQQGAQAVLIDPGSIRLRRIVRLVHQPDLPLTIEQDQVLKQVEQAILQHGKGFITLAGPDDTTDYQVAVTAAGTYEIWDPAGAPIAHLRPALSIERHGAAERVVRRLVHLTKYRNILQLENADITSPLAGKLAVDLAGVQAEYDPQDRPEPQPFRDSGNTPILKPGAWTFLRVKNASPQVLNVTVLDLGPDWSITQIYPSQQDTLTMTFDPGQEILFPLQAYLPEGYTNALDILKVFATVGSTNFRWLELPALDQPSVSKGTRGAPRNALEQLMALLATEESRTRQLNHAVYPTGEWVTAQVEVRVAGIESSL